jgi:hypothetical protein
MDRLTRGDFGEYRIDPYIARARHIDAERQRIQDLCGRLQAEQANLESQLDQLWVAHKTAEFQRHLAARPLDELREIPGIGPVTLRKLEEAGAHNLLDLHARRHIVHNLQGVSQRGKVGIARYVQEAAASARSQPVKLAVDKQEVRRLIELIIDHDWLTGVSMSANRAVMQIAALARQFPTISFIQYMFGRRGTSAQQTDAAMDALDRIVSFVRDTDRGEKANYSTLSQNDYIRAIELLQRRYPQAGEDGTSAPWEGGIPANLTKKIEAFTLDTSGLQNCLLRRYQDFGAKFILVRKQCFLGDEMGLGKTIQTLAAIAHLEACNGKIRALVIVPASLRENWLREVDDKTRLNAFVIRPSQTEQDVDAWQAKGGIGIISYDTLRGKHKALMPRMRFLDFVVADEAQYIKNPHTKRAKATRAVFAQARYALAMTGTPIENHPEEFLAITRGLRHGNATVSRMTASRNPGSPDYFKRAVKDLYLRRNKEDVLNELPDLNEINESIVLDRADLKSHLAMMNAGAHFMHLRQHAIFGDGDESPKIARVQELIQEYVENGRSVVVFTYFKRVIDTLSVSFPDAGVIMGAVSTSERMNVIDELNENSPTGKIILAQIGAGGVGLNMQAASAVILVEPQLNPAAEYQAICRVHRMGQRRSVNVHRLTSLHTIEEGIVESLAQKRRYMDDYARDSLLKESSPAAISAQEMTEVIAAQRQKLSARLAAS